MPGWNKTSVDELLADPIIRDVMAADGVAPSELRTLLYDVQRVIESYATSQGRPTALARFAKLCSTGRRAALADCSMLSTARVGSRFDQMRCTARS
jgi:hypothetical protein